MTAFGLSHPRVHASWSLLRRWPSGSDPSARALSDQSGGASIALEVKKYVVRCSGPWRPTSLLHDNPSRGEGDGTNCADHATQNPQWRWWGGGGVGGCTVTEMFVVAVFPEVSVARALDREPFETRPRDAPPCAGHRRPIMRISPPYPRSPASVLVLRASKRLTDNKILS